MRHFIFGLYASLVLLVTPAWAGDLQKFRAYVPPRPPITVPYHDARGQAQRFGDFDADIVLVNFWAIWCPPCRTELPRLGRLAAEMNGQVEVVAIEVGHNDNAAVESFLANNGLSDLARNFDRRHALARAADIVLLPTTLILDRRGYLLGRIDGDVDFDSPEVRAAIFTLAKAGG